MGYSAEDLTEIAKQIRYDLTAAQGKLTDLMNGISDLAAKLPDDQCDVAICPKCDLAFFSEKRVIEHLENVHGVIAA